MSGPCRVTEHFHARDQRECLSCLPLYWQRYCPVEILSIISAKNNLMIEYKHRLTCFYELYVYNLDFFVCLLWLRLCLWITEENMQTKRRFSDIKRDFIEQKEHLLKKWMSSECNHMKIKGKWLIWSLFLTCVTLLLGWLLFVIICLLGYVLK
jgi:hypothetical protein